MGDGFILRNYANKSTPKSTKRKYYIQQKGKRSRPASCSDIRPSNQASKAIKKNGHSNKEHILNEKIQIICSWKNKI